MKDYTIIIEKNQQSLLTVPAKNKKEAINRAERLISDIEKEHINIDDLISWNPKIKLKIKKNSTKKGAFFNGGN